MDRSTWKKGERKVCRFFNLKRVPLSGGNSGHTRADCYNPVNNEDNTLFIEIKHRSKHQVVSLWDKTKALADKEGKTPVVCLIEKNRPGFWILVKDDDLVKL
jgi:hypothetical protein